MTTINNMSYEDVIEDIKAHNNMGQVIIKSNTPIGFLTIKKINNNVLVLSDHFDKELAHTNQVNENGLVWLKREARGQHGWDFKLKWALTKINTPKPSIKGG